MKPRILVVDDEQAIRNSICEFLKIRLGCDVIACGDSVEAMAAMDRERFDVLIQDLQMPNIDGITVIIHGKKTNPKLIPVLITRLSEESKIAQAEKLGAIYIPKPFELKMVQKIIERELTSVGEFEFNKS